jgi:hypothetical protein
MSTAERDMGIVPAIVPAGTHRKEIEIRTQFERSPRAPMWIVGISVCLLAATGIVAVVRAIPASYAHAPEESAKGSYVDDPQTRPAVEEDTISRRSRAWCPECGFVESIRYIERSGNAGIAGGVSRGASDSTMAVSAALGKNYEITVRFRDGSTTVFNEATPRTWRLRRVIVIGGSNAR